MKKLIVALVLVLSIPNVLYAAPVSPVPWFTNSTSSPVAYPVKVNNIHPPVRADYFIATSTTATSTFANGISLTDGCFSVLGTCIGGISSVAWGSITGTLSDQTDLQSALDAKVPYTGATANVNLGAFEITTPRINGDATTGLTINSPSLGLNILSAGDILIDTFNSGNYARLDTALLSGSQDFAFPNQSGTFALTSDIPVIGSGTTGQFPYYAANGTDLTATSSIFVFPDSSIGIGTTTSASPAKLIVDGRVKVTSSNGSMVIGDVTGNSRGTRALDIQTNRTLATQIASGLSSVAVGVSNTVSGNGSMVFGNSNTASGNTSILVGSSNADG
ncbi:MAG TPA: hypothetical protein V6D19_12920, partial [Stenomitos sp.]